MRQLGAPLRQALLQAGDLLLEGLALRGARLRLRLRLLQRLPALRARQLAPIPAHFGTHAVQLEASRLHHRMLLLLQAFQRHLRLLQVVLLRLDLQPQRPKRRELGLVVDALQGGREEGMKAPFRSLAGQLTRFSFSRLFMLASLSWRPCR